MIEIRAARILSLGTRTREAWSTAGNRITLISSRDNNNLYSRIKWNFRDINHNMEFRMFQRDRTRVSGLVVWEQIKVPPIRCKIILWTLFPVISNNLIIMRIRVRKCLTYQCHPNIKWVIFKEIKAVCILTDLKRLKMQWKEPRTSEKHTINSWRNSITRRAPIYWYPRKTWWFMNSKKRIELHLILRRGKRNMLSKSGENKKRSDWPLLRRSVKKWKSAVLRPNCIRRRLIQLRTVRLMTSRGGSRPMHQNKIKWVNKPIKAAHELMRLLMMTNWTRFVMLRHS